MDWLSFYNYFMAGKTLFRDDDRTVVAELITYLKNAHKENP